MRVFHRWRRATDIDNRGELSPTRDEAARVQYDSYGSAEDYAKSYEILGPHARFLRTRTQLVLEALTSVAGGDLLDVGCGPGLVLRDLLGIRSDDFRVTAVDRSLAMVKVCGRRASEVGRCTALVGRVEELPFADDSFDVVLAMGVLEYTDLASTLKEISRVIRPDGLFLLSMLNPSSSYRIVQWYIAQPLSLLRERLKGGQRVVGQKWFGPGATGMRAYRETRLRRRALEAGLVPVDAVYFDLTLLVRRWTREQPPSRSADGIGLQKCMGTAYLVAARKAATTGGVRSSTAVWQ